MKYNKIDQSIQIYENLLDSLNERNGAKCLT